MYAPRAYLREDALKPRYYYYLFSHFECELTGHWLVLLVKGQCLGYELEEMKERCWLCQEVTWLLAFARQCFLTHEISEMYFLPFVKQSLFLQTGLWFWPFALQMLFYILLICHLSMPSVLYTLTHCLGIFVLPCAPLRMSCHNHNSVVEHLDNIKPLPSHSQQQLSVDGHLL